MAGLGLNTRANKHQMDQTEETGENWASTVVVAREDVMIVRQAGWMAKTAAEHEE